MINAVLSFSFFFFSAFQQGFKKWKKKKPKKQTHPKQKSNLTFYFQAHPVPSQGKKSTEQHLFIKPLLSCLSLLDFGSGFNGRGEGGEAHNREQ